MAVGSMLLIFQGVRIPMNQPGFNGMSCVFDHCLHHDPNFPQMDDYSGEFRDSFISQYFGDPGIFTIFSDFMEYLTRLY